MKKDYKTSETLQANLLAAGKFTGKVLWILVNQYGADPDQVDPETLAGCTLAKYICCLIKDESLPSPEDFLTTSLAMLSDCGLSKWGLTRERYEEAKKV